MKTKIIVGISLLSLMLFALPVLAQVEEPTEPVTSIEDVIGVIETFASWLFTIILAIAVVMLLYAGLLWMTAGGDEEKLGTARKVLIWGLVGIVIALVARGLVAIMRQLVGA